MHCIWTLEGDAASMESDVQPILPDGKSELIAHFGGSLRACPRGRPSRTPTRHPFRRTAVESTCAAAEVRPQNLCRRHRFRPDGAAGFLRESQDRYAGLTPSLSDVSPALARTLESVRSASDDPASVVTQLQSALERVVQPVADARVRHVVERIGRARGMVSISDLAAAVSLTPRHLERRFMQIVGMSPKRLARIARFQYALAMLDQLEPAPGTRTAAACGFADQAHFVRDFRELAGCPPGEHMLQRAELTGFFTERRHATRARE